MEYSTLGTCTNWAEVDKSGKLVMMKNFWRRNKIFGGYDK